MGLRPGLPSHIGSRDGLRACERPFCPFRQTLAGHSCGLGLGRFPRCLSTQLRRPYERSTCVQSIVRNVYPGWVLSPTCHAANFGPRSGGIIQLPAQCDTYIIALMMRTVPPEIVPQRQILILGFYFSVPSLPVSLVAQEHPRRHSGAKSMNKYAFIASLFHSTVLLLINWDSTPFSRMF